MFETVQSYLVELEEKIQQANMDLHKPIHLAECCIEITLESLRKLRTFISKCQFRNQHEEIEFFKKVKPQFVSKLIYFNSIYIIETHKPNGGEQIIRKYLHNELLKLKQFFDANIEFYTYHRTGSNYLDTKYFLRGKYDIKLNVDSFFFETDPKFCSSHDFKVAKIIANDLLQVYLEKSISNLEFSEYQATLNFSQDKPKTKLNWTGSKVALTELMYGCYYLGVFNNGTLDLKEIAASLEKSFNIELGDFYRTYLELRLRKNTRTKFIDKLRDTLHTKMDELDDF